VHWPPLFQCLRDRVSLARKFSVNASKERTNRPLRRSTVGQGLLREQMGEETLHQDPGHRCGLAPCRRARRHKAAPNRLLAKFVPEPPAARGVSSCRGSNPPRSVSESCEKPAHLAVLADAGLGRSFHRLAGQIAKNAPPRQARVALDVDSNE